MIVLAIETAGPTGGAAILSGGKIVAEETFQTRGRLGAELTPAIDAVLAKAGLSQSNPPDIVAVDIGPGSYTGIRVGLAVAKGLAFGWSKPLVGVNSLEAIASLAPPRHRRVAVAMDARRGEIYGGLFELEPKSTGMPKVRTIQNSGVIAPVEFGRTIGTEPVFIMGNASPLLCAVMPDGANHTRAPESLDYPTPGRIAELGERLYHRGRLDDALSVTPVYMQKSIKEENRSRKRRRTKTKVELEA